MPRVEVKLSELFTFEAITRALEPPQESPAGMGVIFGKKVIKNDRHFVGFRAGNRLD
jgi:hypothetical protein